MFQNDSHGTRLGFKELSRQKFSTDFRLYGREERNGVRGQSILQSIIRKSQSLRKRSSCMYIVVKCSCKNAELMKNELRPSKTATTLVFYFSRRMKKKKNDFIQQYVNLGVSISLYTKRIFSESIGIVCERSNRIFSRNRIRKMCLQLGTMRSNRPRTIRFFTRYFL